MSDFRIKVLLPCVSLSDCLAGQSLAVKEALEGVQREFESVTGEPGVLRITAYNGVVTAEVYRNEAL